MSEPLYSIDDLFFKSIEDHTEQPSGSAWENIEAGLDQENTSYPHNGKSKKIFLVLLLLLPGIMIHDLYQRDDKKGITGNAKMNTESNRDYTKQPAINSTGPGSNTVTDENTAPSAIVAAVQTSTKKNDDTHQIIPLAPVQKLNTDGSAG